MKRYIVIDNKTGEKRFYSWFEWNIAWIMTFLAGVVSGILILNAYLQ